MFHKVLNTNKGFLTKKYTVKILISNSEYLVRNPVQAALWSNKRQKGKKLWNMFGLAWPWDPRGPGIYSKFVLSPLMIDLWMEVCHILMICPYFSWKSRRSSAKDFGLNTNTRYFGSALFINAFRNTNIVGILFFFMTKFAVVLAIMDIAFAKSDVNCPK